MRETTNYNEELGELAQQILNRIVTDTDFREFLSKVDFTSDEVTGYIGKPGNMLVDPILPPTLLNLEKLIAASDWLAILFHMGIVMAPPATPATAPTPHPRRQKPSNSPEPI